MSRYHKSLNNRPGPKRWELVTDCNARHTVTARNGWEARQKVEQSTGKRVVYLSEVTE